MNKLTQLLSLFSPLFFYGERVAELSMVSNFFFSEDAYIMVHGCMHFVGIGN